MSRTAKKKHKTRRKISRAVKRIKPKSFIIQADTDKKKLFGGTVFFYWTGKDMDTNRKRAAHYPEQKAAWEICKAIFPQCPKHIIGMRVIPA